jgi:acetyl-CoA carboxylase, biotin carboxylase subunit
MNALEDKALSRALAKKAGVPIPPGRRGLSRRSRMRWLTAKRIGYPVMIKAVAGGGGRGMRVAHNDISLIKGYHTARTEAEKAFGNSGFTSRSSSRIPHHIEFQILGDNRGNIIHLGERIVPSSAATRRSSRKRHRRSSRQVQGSPQENGQSRHSHRRNGEYTNAGTVEFIVDDSGNFYLSGGEQAHPGRAPITEEVTGVDLVKQQILIAMGEPLKNLGERHPVPWPRHRMPHQRRGSF